MDLETLKRGISETLRVEGVDRLGIVRKLILNEPVAGQPIEWLRCAGFVHLATASGIHLYVASDALERAGTAVGRVLDVSPLVLRRALDALSLLLWLLLWALAGFRPGFFRPLLLVGYRKLARARGWRTRRWAPLAISLAFDAGLSTVRAFDPNVDFGHASMGSAHYAFAVAGGILGYEIAKAKGWNGFKLHLSLAAYSWILTAILDLGTGILSPWTVPLSLLSIPLVSVVFYPIFLVGIFFALFDGWAGAEFLFSWSSLALNALAGRAAEFVTRTHGVRRIELEAAVFAVFLGGVASFFLRWADQRSRRPPSTTKTSPVTQAASSLSRNRMEPATSRGSPTRPSGKAAPRRA